MTATYWEIGRRIVEFEQGGKKRAGYGEELLSLLAVDLTERFGRGFSRFNLARFRTLYLAIPSDKIRATLSLKSVSAMRPTPSSISEAGAPGAERPDAAPPIRATASLELPSTGRSTFSLAVIAKAFPLPWSHYVLLLKSRSPEAFDFYHAEALRGGWSVRQLGRQIDSLFYERSHGRAKVRNRPPANDANRREFRRRKQRGGGGNSRTPQ